MMNMKNYFKKLALTVLFLLAPALAFGQQNTLIQTTLAAAVPSTPSTNPFASSQTFIQVGAVASGITGIQLNPTTTLNVQNVWQAYVDRELMTIVSINGTVLQVQRGQGGTVAAPHASGTMVLFGRAAWFYIFDPGGTPGSGTGVSGLSCTASTVFVTPYLNVRTGGQWLCSSQTSTWVAGWNNAVATEWTAVTGSVASVAGATTITGPLFHITGTNAITSWTIPVGMNATSVGAASFCVIPDAIFTTTATNNIAKATTAVVNQTLCMTWDAKNSKFVPSY